MLGGRKTRVCDLLIEKIARMKEKERREINKIKPRQGRHSKTHRHIGSHNEEERWQVCRKEGGESKVRIQVECSKQRIGNRQAGRQACNRS